MQEVLSAQRRWLGESYRTDRDAPHVLLFQVPTTADHDSFLSCAGFFQESP